MIRRPPRSTLTYTLFPYATLFRVMLIRAVDLGLDRGGAGHRGARSHRGGRRAEGEARDVPQGLERGRARAAFCDHRVEESAVPFFLFGHLRDFARQRVAVAHHILEDRRVGQEGVSTCSTRWCPFDTKKKKT